MGLNEIFKIIILKRSFFLFGKCGNYLFKVYIVDVDSVFENGFLLMSEVIVNF